MITACVCFRKSFSEIKCIAAEKSLTTMREVEETTQCGTKCGLCIPYIKEMLETGKTEFDGPPIKTERRRLKKVGI